MKKDFDSILDKCLSQIKTGEVDIESCLRQYPEYVARLRPLLETAASLWQKPQPQPRTEAVSQGEQLMLERVVEKQSSKAHRKGLVRAVGDKIGIGGGVPGRRPFLSPRWRMRWVAVVASILALFVLSGGVVAASNNSMPGELLYPVKIATEQARLVLTLSEEGKTELHITFAERRIEEIVEMGKRGEAEQVAKLAPMVAQHLEEARQVIVATGEGKTIQELKAKLEESAVQQLAVLEGAWQQATEDTKPVLTQALETSGESYGTAIEAAIVSAPAPPLVGKVGTIQIFVTDPPAPNVFAVWVEVSKIEVHLAAGPDSRWISIFDDPENPVRFNLKEIVGVEEFVCSQEVDAGTYTQLRMHITEATIVEKIDEDVFMDHDAFVPSGRLKFVRPFTIEDGEIKGLVLDFDGDRSLNVTGAGQYMLKPVVMLLVPEGKGKPEQVKFVGTLSEEEGQWFITVDGNTYILDLSEVEEVEGTLEEGARAKVKGVLEEDTILATEVEVMAAEGQGAEGQEAEEVKFEGTIKTIDGDIWTVRVEGEIKTVDVSEANITGEPAAVELQVRVEGIVSGEIILATEVEVIEED